MPNVASPVERSRGGDLVLRSAYAAFGLALAVGIAPVTIAPAAAGQLPGFMSVNDLDASGPMRTVALAILLPFFAALAASPLIERLTQRWSRLIAGWGAVAALGLATAGASFVVIAMTGAVTSAIALATGQDLRWTRDDFLLLPCALAFFALLTTAFPSADFTTCAAIAALLLLLVRVVIGRSARIVRHGIAFGLVPAAACLLLFFPHSRVAAIVGSLLVLLLPFVSAIVPTRVLCRTIAFVALPLFVYAYASIQRPFHAEGIPRINFFEDGHSLLPASEMLRGERPYRDIVPGHGLVSDGLLDYFTAKLWSDDLGTILTVRERIEPLLAVAIYFVGFAATGSGLAGIAAFLLATSIRVFWTPLEPAPTALLWTPAIRSLPAVVSLVFVLLAIRRRSFRHLGIAVAIAASTAFVSVDFGAYALLVVAIAAYLMGRGGNVRRAAVVSSIGAVVGAAIGFVPLLFLGVGVDFVRVTLSEVLSLRAAYAVGFFHFPERYADYRGLPDVVALLFTPSALWFVTWCAIALFTLAALSSVFRSRLRRSDAILFIGLFVTIEAIAYGERLNVHFMPLASAFAAVAAWQLLRSRNPQIHYAAIGLTALLVVMSGPTRHLRDVSRELNAMPADHAAWTVYPRLPRARGALFRKETAAAMAAVQNYVEGRLAPNETWLDFASMPTLYYLFDRPCPIRQYEVPFFEPEELQVEVIRRVERDPSVRAVLLSFPDIDFPIDGVPSAVRAPLVAQFIQQNFAVDYANAKVTFARRK